MFQGVCRDIQCDQTRYLSFNGSCTQKPEYQNPLCYMLGLKFTPLNNGFLSKSVLNAITTSLVEQSNIIDADVYAKETESNDDFLDYFIVKGITNSVTFASETISRFHNRSVKFGAGMTFLIQLVSHNVSLFNGQPTLEVTSGRFGTNDVLLKIGQHAADIIPAKTDSCTNKTIVHVDYLLKCPFIHLKFTELRIKIMNGNLLFQDINMTSLSWLEYRHVNDSVFICLSDYKRILENLPDIGKSQEETARFFTEISLKNLLSLLCVSVSIVCLLATVVMIIIKPDLHTQPGLNTLILCVCLLLAQAIYQFGVGQTSLPSWACSMIGAMCHLLWLCVMFAMNVCSLDMFLIFRKLKLTKFESPCRKVTKRIMYVLTLSLLFVSINIIVSLSKSGGEDIGYGGIICYISSRVMQILTFVVPSILTLATNITLFIFVVININKTSIQTAGLNQQRNYFEIYARLSTLTGFSWIVGFLLLLIKNEILEYLFILLNASQGLFIMLAFIFNRRLLHACCGKHDLQN